MSPVQSVADVPVPSQVTPGAQYREDGSSFPRMNVSGVPSAGFTKMMSLGSRLGVSMARKTTGASRMLGSAWMMRRLKKSKSPGANSAPFDGSPIQNVPFPERTYRYSSDP